MTHPATVYLATMSPAPITPIIIPPKIIGVIYKRISSMVARIYDHKLSVTEKISFNPTFFSDARRRETFSTPSPIHN